MKKKVSELWFGEGKKIGSIVPILGIEGVNHFIFTIWTDGKIEIPFQWFKKRKAFSYIESRKQIMKKLNEINGININENKLDKRPNIAIKLLKDKDDFNSFVKVFDWMLNEYKK